MLTQQDLRAALRTAFDHCRPGGTALIMPDYTPETFRTGVHHGGNDEEGRALRYLEWTFDPVWLKGLKGVQLKWDSLLRAGNESHF